MSDQWYEIAVKVWWQSGWQSFSDGQADVLSTLKFILLEWIHQANDRAKTMITILSSSFYFTEQNLIKRFCRSIAVLRHAVGNTIAGSLLRLPSSQVILFNYSLLNYQRKRSNGHSIAIIASQWKPVRENWFPLAVKKRAKKILLLSEQRINLSMIVSLGRDLRVERWEWADDRMAAVLSPNPIVPFNLNAHI